MKYIVGNTYYMARHHSNEIRKITLLAGPNNNVRKHSEGFITVRDALGFTSDASLADMGVPPYAYDDRPQQLWPTLAEAEANHPAAKEWFKKFNRERYQ